MEQQNFEVFVKSAYPPWICKFKRKGDGLYASHRLALLYLAWVHGVANTQLSAFLKDMQDLDLTVDSRDDRFFANKRTQRLYWCYLTGKYGDHKTLPCLHTLDLKAAV